ncbi:MAG: hypothetical protein ABIV94_03690 [Acidimicrobiales bacterium]
MALYIPAGRRRGRLVIAAAVALALGLLVGVLVGRSAAPSLEDRVASVRADARQTAAALRVVVLHDETPGVDKGQTGDGGTDLVLTRVRDELAREIHDAVWLPEATGRSLLDDIDALRSRTDTTDTAFAQSAEALAAKIDTTFGM